jgi:hypothetical protein
MLIPGLRLSARIAGAALAFAVLAPATALAATKWADLRVVTHTGSTLAEFRQYTGATTVRASHRADCFGSDNPSSDRHYRIRGASALGIVKDALASDRKLRPLLVNDAFVDDGFGLGVCSIGGFDTEGFSYWYLAHDHVAASTGPDLIPLKNGDEVLWYLTSGSESGFPNELDLRAPARTQPGQPFTVQVHRTDGSGSRSPAAGAAVSADGAPLGVTDANGELTATLPSSSTLQATGTGDDVASNLVAVCVDDDHSACPAAHGERIFGSSHRDRIKGTRGWDAIKARGGRDLVDLRNGGHDRVNCGAGRDRVILDQGDHDDRIAASCERVIRR